MCLVAHTSGNVSPECECTRPSATYARDSKGSFVSKVYPAGAHLRKRMQYDAEIAMDQNDSVLVHCLFGQV